MRPIRLVAPLLIAGALTAGCGGGEPDAGDAAAPPADSAGGNMVTGTTGAPGPGTAGTPGTPGGPSLDTMGAARDTTPN
jgi:hypothetical protein